jgi:hypothetical protein
MLSFRGDAERAFGRRQHLRLIHNHARACRGAPSRITVSTEALCRHLVDPILFSVTPLLFWQILGNLVSLIRRDAP